MILKVLFLKFFIINFSHAVENKILFKINNEIITTIDLFNETKYLKTLNKNLENLEDEKIFEIAKNSLIREKIKKIELSSLNKIIKINENFLENFMLNHAKRNGFSTIADFKKYIEDNNLNFSEVKDKLKIEILWNELIVNKYLREVKIDKDKIKDSIDKFQNEYLLSEIVFSIENTKNLEMKFKTIENDIKEKGFKSASIIHGVSGVANEGGSLGWIKESSLNSVIRDQILNTKIGSYTKPIVIPGGFLILSVESKRKTKRKFNLEDEINLIVKEKTNEQLNRYSIIYFNKVKKNIVINEL